jgi:hypothetical protein
VPHEKGHTLHGESIRLSDSLTRNSSWPFGERPALPAGAGTARSRPGLIERRFSIRSMILPKDPAEQ